MSDRLRVSFVVESGTDVRLVEGLATRYELTVIARRIEGGVVISRPPPESVTVLSGPTGRLAFATFVLRRLLQGRRADRVIVQGYGAAALAANVASRVTGIPTTMLVCSPVEAYYQCRARANDVRKPFRRRELAAMKLLARVNARSGNAYVTLSEHLADVVRHHGGAKIFVIPVYGVETDRFNSTGESRAALRARLELPATGSIVFFSSRIAAEKDADALLRATRRLLDAGRDLWILHLSGGFEEFAERAKVFDVDDRTISRQAVHPGEELADFYRAADVCVQASRAEGLGFSPLEALASGTPVVAAAVGGLLETVVPGETGWTYPVGRDDLLADQIAEVLDDQAEASRRTAAGRQLVERRYRSTRVFADLDEMLRQL